ncbi:MAG: nucleotide exchange factor GrpE [Spirochaetales bacterium]|jgi:molecular chaperone GrpE|nr:nucleotide exchange factor GrpE [Spirochaetales bacterium]
MSENTGEKEGGVQDRPEGVCVEKDGGKLQDAVVGEAVSLAKFQELENARKGLEDENASLKDQCLRIQADADNFRKRMVREKQDSIQAANKQLLTDLLPVMDDFARAIKSGEVSRDFAAFHDGIVMIEKQLSGLLERRWGLKRFDSIGEEFDPQKHEALYSEDRPDHEVSMVLEDYMTGYTLHDKILRAAKVKISMPGQPAGGAQTVEKNAGKNAGAADSPESKDSGSSG